MRAKKRGGTRRWVRRSSGNIAVTAMPVCGTPTLKQQNAADTGKPNTSFEGSHARNNGDKHGGESHAKGGKDVSYPGETRPRTMIASKHSLTPSALHFRHGNETLSRWPVLSRPKKGGERFPYVFLKNTIVASMRSLSSTACFTQTTFSIREVVLDIHTPNVGVLGLSWAYFLWASVIGDTVVSDFGFCRVKCTRAARTTVEGLNPFGTQLT